MVLVWENLCIVVVILEVVVVVVLVVRVILFIIGLMGGFFVGGDIFLLILFFFIRMLCIYDLNFGSKYICKYEFGKIIIIFLINLLWIESNVLLMLLLLF